MHPAQLDREMLLDQCQIRRQRRSGPGGQHRNKVETGIFLEHLPTAVRSEATEQRSQARNLELARHRLRLRLAVQVRSPTRSPAPSERWRSRLQGQRIRVSPEHEDYPALLAEAMDALNHDQWDPKRTADRLACSTSQLIKFIKGEPTAWIEVNRQRAELQLPKLR